MITQSQYHALRRPSSPARAFLYLCNDGTHEVMPPEGGRFDVIDCDDPIMFPLAGGHVTGKRMSDVARAGPFRGPLRGVRGPVDPSENGS